MDWAGEYRGWVKQSGGTVVSFGKGDYINIMDLSGCKPIDRVKQIMNSLDILTDISNFPEQRRLTAEALEQAYLNAGFIISSVCLRRKGGADTKGRGLSFSRRR